METPKFNEFKEYLINARFAVQLSYNADNEKFSEESVIKMFYNINQIFEEAKDEDYNIKSNLTGDLKDIYDASLENRIHRLGDLRFHKNYNKEKIQQYFKDFKITEAEFLSWNNVIDETIDLYLILDTHISWIGPNMEPDVSVYPFLNYYDNYDIQAIQYHFQEYIKDHYVKEMISFLANRFINRQESTDDYFPFRRKIYLEYFNEYTNRHIIDDFVDYSYLFQRLNEKGMIYNMEHKKFMHWLFDKDYITQNQYKKFIVKNSFYTLRKSTKAERENNFNNIFNI